jgi:hypothetical protein
MIGIVCKGLKRKHDTACHAEALAKAGIWDNYIFDKAFIDRR